MHFSLLRHDSNLNGKVHERKRIDEEDTEGEGGCKPAGVTEWVIESSEENTAMNDLEEYLEERDGDADEGNNEDENDIIF